MHLLHKLANSYKLVNSFQLPANWSLHCVPYQLFYRSNQQFVILYPKHWHALIDHFLIQSKFFAKTSKKNGRNLTWGQSVVTDQKVVGVPILPLGVVGVPILPLKVVGVPLLPLEVPGWSALLGEVHCTSLPTSLDMAADAAKNQLQNPREMLQIWRAW